MATPGPIELNVHIAFDEEAGVWYVADTDVPGLSLEAENADQLIARIYECAPRLIELNYEELSRRHAPARRQAMAVTPVFDTPLLIDA